MERTQKQRKEHAEKMRVYWATHPEFRKKQLKKTKIWQQNHVEEQKVYRINYYHNNKTYLDKQNKKWFNNNYEKALEYQRKNTHKYEQKIKQIILKHYGNGKIICIKCKEKKMEFLTIHHMNGKKTVGHSRRMSGSTLYRWLHINKLPKGYQTLCYNCNCSIEFTKDKKIPDKFINKYQKHYYLTFLPRGNNAKILGIKHYTKNKNTCQCCKEKNMDNLTIDHINGRKEVKHSPKQGGIKLWIWLWTHKFPKGFQVLCYNCNSARGNYGTCPHNKIKLR